MFKANNIVSLGDFHPGKTLRTGIPEDTDIFETFRSVKRMVNKFTSFSV